MEFELPLRLKQILLGENESIFRSDQLPALPQKPCVADILSQYVDQSNSEGLDFEQEVIIAACSSPLLTCVVRASCSEHKSAAMLLRCSLVHVVLL